MNSRYAGTKDTDTENVGISRPGSTSPTKLDPIKPLDRKPSMRKQTFKSVSVNKVFLKESTPTLGPMSNALSSSLSNKGKPSLECMTIALFLRLTGGRGGFASLASPAFSVTQPALRNVLGVSKLKFVKTGTSSQTLRLGSAGSTGFSGPKKGEQIQPVWNKNLRKYSSKLFYIGISLTVIK